MSRRSLLRGAALGAGALAVPAALAACGSSKSGSSGTSGTTNKTVSFGSNYSDAVPKKAVADVMAKFHTDKGFTVNVNTVDHNSFQENINRYLKGSPDDAFTWFAGYRMQYFAAQGLATPIDDVWDTIGPNYSDAFAKASTGQDGKKYFVPFYNYPWALFYRKSVWQAKGYTPPATIDDLKTLCAKMKKDGLTPIAFADKDGWPAFGTFDQINMRMNGYDFHISLMGGKASWTDPKVKNVFSLWSSLLPYHQQGALGLTWQEAAQTLVSKKAGMYLLGSFVAQQFPAADLADLDFFAFPQVDAQYGTDAVEAPIDGFMVSKKAKNVAGAKELLKFLGTAEAQTIYLKSDPSDVGANKQVDATIYNAIQQKSAQFIGAAKQISQFLDRDSNPTFASTVAIPAFQQFLNKPGDIDGLVKNIDAQAKTIYAGS
ncbi:MAG TPA: extracellular solute-binding protein [Rugosimonospora sp.]|nr:extracellular solute-binding protein [Rugosimonospora sp.]